MFLDKLKSYIFVFIQFVCLVLIAVTGPYRTQQAVPHDRGNRACSGGMGGLGYENWQLQGNSGYSQQQPSRHERTL